MACTALPPPSLPIGRLSWLPRPPENPDRTATEAGRHAVSAGSRTIMGAMVDSGDLLHRPSPSPPLGRTSYHVSPPPPPPPPPHPLLFTHPYLYPSLQCFGGGLYPLPQLLRQRVPVPGGYAIQAPPTAHSSPRRGTNPFGMDTILGRRTSAQETASGPGLGRLQATSALPGFGGLHMQHDVFGEYSHGYLWCLNYVIYCDHD